MVNALVNSPALFSLSGIDNIEPLVRSMLFTPLNESKSILNGNVLNTGSPLVERLIKQLTMYELTLQDDKYSQETQNQIRNLANKCKLSPQDFVAQSRLYQQFPTTILRLYPDSQLYKSSDDVDSTAIELQEHLKASTLINTVLQLSHNLKHDVQTLPNHKYIAHQLALLYQSINQLRNFIKANYPPMNFLKKDGSNVSTIFEGYKERIEVEFDNVKAGCQTNDTVSDPQLNADLRQWLVSLCTDAIEELSNNAPIIYSQSFK
ncbi:hypothetical protein MP228_007202 [Amoeboaphelidium protococcarum]|nr:hypothetical protein MP228_007202 [Amoeboaphelidium protococcarum]